jgi:hypothetical protein
VADRYQRLLRDVRIAPLASRWPRIPRRTNAEIRELWSRFMQKWIEPHAAVIETERSRGAAPVTLPADELSVALNLMNEKLMLSSFAGDSPSLPNERLLETLVHIWVTSIYGEQS